jgi:hypothetical protein
MSYLPISKQIEIDLLMLNDINRDISGEYIEETIFYNHFFDGSFSCTDSIFQNCVFHNIELARQEINNCNFINCNFYDSQINFDFCHQSGIHFTNCFLNSDLITTTQNDLMDAKEVNTTNEYEKHVLERFWPVGKDRLSMHKQIRTLKLGSSPQETSYLEAAIDSLIRKGIIITPKGKDAVDLNIRMLREIRYILGR